MTSLWIFGATIVAWVLAAKRRVRQVAEAELGWEDEGDVEDEDLPQAAEDEYPCWLPPRPGGGGGAGKLPRREGGPAGCLAPDQVEPRPLKVGDVEVPFAVGLTTPTWPVRTKERYGLVSYVDARGKCHGICGNRFGAKRRKKGKDPVTGKSFYTGEERFHVGVDLGGKAGDYVVAMEAGTIVAIQPFTEGTWAILEETDTGIVILYGEVAKGSWSGLVSVNDRVEAGQKIARIGLMGTKDMLHVETYVKGTRENISWNKTKPENPKSWERWGPPPPEILDPTRYLLLASMATNTIT